MSKLEKALLAPTENVSHQAKLWDEGRNRDIRWFNVGGYPYLDRQIRSSRLITLSWVTFVSAQM
jgi:hypothetical protein